MIHSPKRLGNIIIVLLLLALFPMNAAAVDLTEHGLLYAANECSIKKDYQGAADILEKLLALYPETRNEDAYFKLCDVYDNNLDEYAKAICLYEKYLQLFPGGRFYDRCKASSAFLEKNKDHWEIIKRFRYIKRTFYSRSEIENIKMMRELLSQNPNLYLKADIYKWLANECSYLNQSGQAQKYIEAYFSTFPGNGKPEDERITTYPLYAEILTKAHHYHKAIEVLTEYVRRDPGRAWEYNSRVNFIKKEWRIWTGFVISVVYIAFVLMIVILIKPWKEKDRRLIKFWPFIGQVLLCAVFTMIPMFIVRATGNGIYKTFPTLTILGSGMLFFAGLLAPVSYKISRGAYFLLSFLLSLAVVYISFYIWDTLFIFWTKVQ